MVGLARRCEGIVCRALRCVLQHGGRRKWADFCEFGGDAGRREGYIMIMIVM